MRRFTMENLLKKYKGRKDFYNFLILLSIILFGMLVLTIFFFDFLLISLYLLYVSEILSIVYIIKKQYYYFYDRSYDSLLKERLFLIGSTVSLCFVIFVLDLFNISWAIVLVVILFALTLLVQLFLVHKHLNTYKN